MQSNLNNTTLRIVFDGDLLSTNVDSLRREIIAVIGSHPGTKAIAADLSNCRLVDSKGVNLLIALFRESQNRGWAFSAVNPTPDVRRLLALLNLTERFGLSNPN
jgi:anti-anti-sigma factor